MANIVTYLTTLFKPYYKYVIGLILLLIFIGVAKYTYEKMYATKQINNKFNDVANASDVKPIITIFFFFVDWCPHCLKAKPEWHKFKQQYDNSVINGYVVKCYEIDCTDDNGNTVTLVDPKDNSNTNVKPTSIKTSEIIRKYKIESYPTIKLIKNGTTYDYDAKVESDSLGIFVKTT